MRVFNLKDSAIRRIRGLENEIPTGDPGAKASEKLDPTLVPVLAAETEESSMRIVWRTDIGKVRKNNQDAVILGNGLAGVADGMGGHQGGEIASAGLRDGLLRETRGKEPSEETLRAAVETVNLELWQQQENDASLTGMGTTLTVLWPTADRMLIAQVGDSRAYLMREGELKQVTSDHSMVADMVRRGVLTEEQAACHPMRNYITRAVGTEDTIETDIISMPRLQGDRWLVCSDGLHGMVSRAELTRMMLTENPEEAANQMLAAALENGGRDNISLVIVLDTEGPATAGADPLDHTLKPGTADPLDQTLKPAATAEKLDRTLRPEAAEE